MTQKSYDRNRSAIMIQYCWRAHADGDLRPAGAAVLVWPLQRPVHALRPDLVFKTTFRKMNKKHNSLKSLYCFIVLLLLVVF